MLVYFAPLVVPHTFTAYFLFPVWTPHQSFVIKVKTKSTVIFKGKPVFAILCTFIYINLFSFFE